MMKKQQLKNWINYFTTLVWIINGLFCKVLNLVPRHQEIVERVLNIDNARSITLLIGIAETGIATWIFIGFWPKLNTVVQISIITIMNTLEFFLAPDLLLWGKVNALFAFLFIVLLYFKEFYLNSKTLQTAV